MTGIRRLASLPVAAVAILALLVVAMTFAPPPALGQSNSTPARPTGLTAEAGHLSVTLRWDDPGSNANITGYQYQWRNHPGYGWAEWADLTGSDGTTTSHTFTDLTAGKEYRYKIRAVDDPPEQEAAYSKPAPAASPWYVAATPIDPKPPALSDLWTVRVCDDLFKVRWQWVPGATGYDLEMSGNGRQSWQRKMTNKNGNGWQFSKWTKDATFWFRVRAVNAHGASEWRYVKSIAPPCAVEGLEATRMPTVGGQSGTISVSWDAAHRASGYDVNFTADNGKSWQRMVTDLKATSYEFDKQIPYNPNYRVAVQSRRKGVTSGWTNAPIAGLTVANVAGTTATLNFNGYSGNWYYKSDNPPDDTDCKGPVNGAVKDLTGLNAGTDYQYTAYSDSGCTDTISSVTFATPVTLTVTNITATGATLNLAGHSGQWWYKADAIQDQNVLNPDVTCQGPVAANDSDDDLTGLTVHQQYTYKAYNASGCNDGDLLASITFEPSGDVLTAKEVTATTAVLELEHHIGDWWFKQTAPTEGTCTAGEADFNHALSDLIPGTEYTYKSYDVSDCGDTHVGASVDFTTGGVSVSNLSHQNASGCLLGSTGDEKCATGFTTGDAANGYTLHSITAAFSHTNGSPSNFAVALYGQSGNRPASAAISNATLSGSTPSSAGNYTYSCAGDGCDLSRNTTYYVVMSADGGPGNAYAWFYTASHDETTTPDGNGWSIDDKRYTGSTLSSQSTSQVGRFKVAATTR